VLSGAVLPGSAAAVTGRCGGSGGVVRPRSQARMATATTETKAAAAAMVCLDGFGMDVPACALPPGSPSGRKEFALIQQFAAYFRRERRRRLAGTCLSPAPTVNICRNFCQFPVAGGIKEPDRLAEVDPFRQAGKK